MMFICFQVSERQPLFVFRLLYRDEPEHWYVDGN